MSSVSKGRACDLETLTVGTRISYSVTTGITASVSSGIRFGSFACGVKRAGESRTFVGNIDTTKAQPFTVCLTFFGFSDTFLYVRYFSH